MSGKTSKVNKKKPDKVTVKKGPPKFANNKVTSKVTKKNRKAIEKQKATEKK